VKAPTNLREISAVFARLGLTSFGGPIAHVALMRQELVARRGWLTDAEFLDLHAATQLIPGPNSTELAIHIGYRQGGWRGLVAAGVCFILPAAIIVALLGAVYTRYGRTPQAAWLLYGIHPVIIAIVAVAIAQFAPPVLRRPASAAIAALVAVAALRGGDELLLLGLGGAAGLLMRLRPRVTSTALWIATAATASALAAVESVGLPVHVSLTRLTLFFLKVGSVLFGSGYVLLAFLRADLVERWNWLTDQQLVDAIAVGQITPGPVFTTATFIGYLLHGWSGAILATIGIFLPAFLFVALTHPFIDRMRRSAALGGLLDGLVAASLGLMVPVVWQLARSAIVDVPTMAIAIVTVGLLFRQINSTWLVCGGAIAGWIFR
jgi:chromate transporter